MGCGTSRSTFTDDSRKFSEPAPKVNDENAKLRNPDAGSFPVQEELCNERFTEGGINAAGVVTPDSQSYGGSGKHVANVRPDVKILHEHQQSVSRNSSSLDELETLENALADATVHSVLQNIQHLDNTGSTVGDSITNIKLDAKAVKKNKLGVNDLPNIPAPSGKPVITNSLENAIQSNALSDALHQACSLTDNKKLVNLAKQANTLRIDRTFYCFTKSDLLCEVLYEMSNLKVIDLRGGQSGPIGFRAITYALLTDHHVTDLVLSDNLANPECSESLGRLISINETLQRINVSSNQLGKDALSRFVGASLRDNSTLVSLNISSCGATDLHCLCESIRNSTSSTLKTLIASHNYMNDGHQFGVDISLIIESGNCCLEQLDVTNTGITSSGTAAIGESLVKNKSIQSLSLGQNTVKNPFKVFQFLANCITHPRMEEINLNKLKVEEIAPDDNWKCVHEKELDSVSHLTHIGIADCGVNDNLVETLAAIFANKLNNLQDLDISSNPELGIDKSMAYFDKLSDGHLKSLKLSLCEELSGLPGVLASGFQSLKAIDVSKSRLTPATLTEMASLCTQTFNNISLNGVKLSGSVSLTSLLSSNCCSALSSLHLSGCQLNDADVEPISSALRNCQARTLPLEQINLSVNRLTNSYLESMSESLLTNSTHVLNNIDLSNNEIGGPGLAAFMRLFNTMSHKSMINCVNLSCNMIPPISILEFFKLFDSVKFPFVYLDLRNQEECFREDDAESLADILKNTIFRADLEKTDHFTVNILGLGGSDVPSVSALDSSALRTDFVTLRNPTVALKDMLDIGKGLSVLNNVLNKEHSYGLMSESWGRILGKEAPGWASVSSELSKAAYVNRLPGTVTVQRLQGTLELEADCEVKDVYLVKDPIMKKPTGAAWVLFEDIQSKANAVDWYRNGNAQMYGTPFSISEVPVLILDESSHVGAVAERELAVRELEKKKEMEREKKMLEESQQLAAERAEYREAHPAYQGGRIS